MLNGRGKMHSASQKVGEKIRELRHKFNISQEELASISNCDRTYIGKVERGEKNITINKLEQICRALNTTLSEITDFSK